MYCNLLLNAVFFMSGHTEVLYHRPGFGAYLHTRQRGLGHSVRDASTVAAVSIMNDNGESRVKGKKSKGKK
jgi:hypothetical protein